MQPDYGEDYLAWLAAAPKGVRWDKAQEMWEEYNRKRREHAEVCAKRLLGIKPKWGGIDPDGEWEAAERSMAELEARDG